MNNFVDAFARVQSMLSTEDGQRQIRDMMSSLQNSSSFSTPPTSASTPVPEALGGMVGNLFGGVGSTPSVGAPPMSMPALGGMEEMFGGGGMDKAQLLHALKPHLSNKRLGKFDTAVKILQVSKVANKRNLSNILNIFGG